MEIEKVPPFHLPSGCFAVENREHEEWRRDSIE